jgi:hypothetical protein
MIYVIVVASLLVIGLTLYLLHQNTRFDFDGWYPPILTVGIILLLLGTLGFLSVKTNNRDFILQGQTLQQTLDDARKNGTSDMERAAILTKVVEYNTKLNSVLYWYPKTQAWVGIFRDPAILEVKPIK